MTSEPDMTGRGTSLIRKAAERFAVTLFALVLAFSFPVLSSGVDTGAVDTATPAHQMLGALASPEATILSPAVETSSEFDRSRDEATPAVLDTPFVLPRWTVVLPGLFRLALDADIPTRSVVLPPGRGPPSVS